MVMGRSKQTSVLELFCVEEVGIIIVADRFVRKNKHHIKRYRSKIAYVSSFTEDDLLVIELSHSSSPFENSFPFSRLVVVVVVNTLANTTMLSRLTLIGAVVLCASHVRMAMGFLIVSVPQQNSHSTSRSSCTRATQTISTVRRHMGLYDEPLPPRPAPRKKPDKRPKTENDEEDDDNDVLLASVNDAPPERLFFLKETGKEARNLLPPLSRRLTTGID
jgi:hypothetical protein